MLNHSLQFSGVPARSTWVLAATTVALLVGGFSVLSVGTAQESKDRTVVPSAAAVQEKLRQWVHVQLLISQERADWDAQKQTLRDLEGLREREVAQLGELIEAAGNRLADAEQQRTDLNAEESMLRERRVDLEQRIDGLEAAARQLLPGLPKPLRDRLGDTIERLANDAESDTTVPLQNRYRDVLALLTEIISFQSKLTLDTELRKLDGGTVQIEVLYLGLGQAYYVDRSSKHAGIGQPGGADGWIWEEQPELAASVRRTIDIFRKQVSPELVELPLQLRVEP